MDLQVALKRAEQENPELAAQFVELLKEQKKRISRNKIATYAPYPKQKLFHDAGSTHRERLLMAGNQLGKTLAGAAEMAYHLTGLYPDWWEGRRYTKPILAMCGSESAELTRDGIQTQLVGPPEEEDSWGTGMIPGDRIVDWSRRQGVANAIDTILVKHARGGNSTLLMKSYDQKRRKWQATTADLVWFDEEPPEDIYTEGLTRTNATGGMVYLTFTPLLGISDVVLKFLEEDQKLKRLVEDTAGAGGISVEQGAEEAAA